jgi:hypothetical protein
VRLPPFFWYERDAALRRRFLMVSMLYWDVAEPGASQKLLLPVFYRWREEDRTLWVSLPFVVSYRRPGEAWLSAGPFFRHAGENKSRTLLFPVFWRQERRGGGTVTSAPPFLFYGYRSRDGRKADAATPAGWYRRRGEKSSGMALNYWWSREPENGFETLFPIYWRLKSPVDRLAVLVPFYYRREILAAPAAAAEGGPPPSRKWAGLFPVAGRAWGPELSSHHLFPLYYHSRREGGRVFVTLPFSRIRRDDRRAGHAGPYFYSRDPDLNLRGVFPLWHRLSSADDYESRLQVLNFFSRRENEDSFQTLFPLYGLWSTPERTQFVSWGAWRRKSPDGDVGLAGPYYWKRQGPDTTRVFFPLYWHFWRAPDWKLDVFFPFYARYRDGDTVVTAVPPVIRRRTPERSTYSLLFFYWRDQGAGRGSTSLFPLFHYNYNDRRRMFFSPLAWTRRSASSREGIIPPVYWYRSGEAKRLFVFPLYWRTAAREKGLTVVPPYYNWRRKDGSAYGLFPVWGRHSFGKERGDHLLPFYWRSRDEAGNGRWIIPPALAYVSKTGRGTESPETSAQYLLLGNVRSTSQGLSHDFFPLYKYIRSEDFRNFWAPRGVALAAWERRGDSRKGYVFPYAWRRDPAKDWDLFLPLWYRADAYEVDRATGMPAVRGEKTGAARVLFPLYWSSENPDRTYRFFVPLYAGYAEGARRVGVLAPLWVSFDGTSGRKFRALLPLYWRVLLKREPEAGEPAVERDITVLGPLYRADVLREGRRSRTVGLAPLFSNTRAGPDDKYFEILGGLFARDVQDGKRRFRILYFFYTKPR